MRRIDAIVLHCTAGSQKQTIDGLKAWWRDGMKWKQVGYHWVIEADGGITQLVTDDIVTNGVAGHNAHSIHISYFGGVNLRTWKAVDNRTPAQREAMFQLVRSYKLKYPEAKVLGHRDFLKKGKPGWKDCPSFDVATWLNEVGLK